MTKRFMTPREAAEYLSINPKTIYSLAARELLPVIRFGRQLRIDLKQLDEDIAAGLLPYIKNRSAVPVNVRRPLRAPGPSSFQRGQHERDG